MAVTLSPRLGITRWSAGADPLSRAQLDADHAALDLLTALDAQGTLAARPAAGIRGRYYYATDTGILSRDTGAAWVSVNDHGGLVGLTDDDHPQYHNDARGDARYPRLTVLTADGDLVTRAAGAWSRVPLGAALSQLRVNAAGTAVEYAAPAATGIARTFLTMGA